MIEDTMTPDRAALEAARFTATYWRDAIMANEGLRSTGMSHPVACILAAIDGESDPAQLGIAEDQWPAFRAALTAPPAPEAAAVERCAWRAFVSECGRPADHEVHDMSRRGTGWHIHPFHPAPTPPAPEAAAVERLALLEKVATNVANVDLTMDQHLLRRLLGGLRLVAAAALREPAPAPPALGAEELRDALVKDIRAELGRKGLRPALTTTLRDRLDAIIAAARLPLTGLDEAWAAVKAVLPKGMEGPNLIHYEDYTGQRSWIAEAGIAPKGARVWADTPINALRALAAALARPEPGDFMDAVVPDR